MPEEWSVLTEAGRAQVTRSLTLILHYHAGQTRKDGTTPYLVHLLRVGMTLLQAGASLPVVCAGLTHDLIEDTKASWDTIADALGPEVADLVAAVSEDKRRPRAERKAEYFGHLSSQPPEVQMLKLADWLDNVRDVATASWSPAQKRSYLRRAEQVWEQTAGHHEALRVPLRAALDEQWAALPEAGPKPENV
jgi:guanosine-3',5'-bis(diphosphate) 3'-pyrophosphohydrolase